MNAGKGADRVGQRLQDIAALWRWVEAGGTPPQDAPRSGRLRCYAPAIL